MYLVIFSRETGANKKEMLNSGGGGGTFFTFSGAALRVERRLETLRSQE